MTTQGYSYDGIDEETLFPGTGVRQPNPSPAPSAAPRLPAREEMAARARQRRPRQQETETPETFTTPRPTEAPTPTPVTPRYSVPETVRGADAETLFENNGGDLQRLSEQGFRTAKDDSDAQALAALPREQRRRVLESAGYDADTAADVSRDLEVAFGTTGLPEFTKGKAAHLLATVTSGGLYDIYNTLSVEGGTAALGGALSIVKDRDLPSFEEAYARGQEAPVAARIVAILATGALIPATPLEAVAAKGAFAAVRTTARAGATQAGRALDTALTQAEKALGDESGKLTIDLSPKGVGPNPVNATVAGEQVFGFQPIKPGLSRADRMQNVVRSTVLRPIQSKRLGFTFQDDPIATPAMAAMARERHTIASVANAVQEAYQTHIKRIFPMDKQYRIASLEGVDPTLQGAPTLADVARRLPRFEASLTKEQHDLIISLRETVKPFQQVLQDADASYGKAPDILDGGFYLPRGRADLEGADVPMKIGGHHASSLPESKRTVFTDSQAQGIAAGYEYAAPWDALGAFVRHAGNTASDAHIANYLKQYGTTLRERMPQDVLARVDKLKNQMRSRRITLARQNVRAGVAFKEAERRIREMEGAGERHASAAYRRLVRGAQASPEALSDAKQGLAQAIEDGRLTALHMGEDLQALRATNTGLNAAERAAERKLEELQRLLLAGGAREQMSGAGFVQYEGRLQRAIDDAIADARHLRDKADSIRDALAAGSDAAKGARAAQGSNRDAILAAMEERRVLSSLDREITMLDRELSRAASKNTAAQGRAVAAGRKAATFGDEYDAMRQEYHALRGQLIERRDRFASGIQLPSGRLQGYLFDLKLANAANKVLVRDHDPAWVATLRAVNSLLRGSMATADMSFMGIQGLLAAADDPKAAGRALWVGMRALGQADSLSHFVSNFDAASVAGGKLTAAQWARYGIRVGGSSTEFALGQEGMLHRIGQAPVVQQFNNAFGYAGDSLRLSWADDLLEGEMRKGRTLQEIAQSGDLQRIAKIANNATGWSEGKVLGSTGDFFLFAPRYLMSRFEAVGMAVSGLKPGHAGLDQRRAMMAMTKLLGYSVAATVLINEAQGRETDFAIYRRNPVTGEMEWNPNFMRARIAGRDVALMGPWDSLLRAAGIMVEPAAGGRLHPQDAARGLLSPIVSGGVEQIANADYFGNPTRDSWTTAAKWLANTASPFTTEHIPQLVAAAKRDGLGAAGAQGALDFFGVKSSPPTLTDRQDALVQLWSVNKQGEQAPYDDPTRITRWSELEPGAKGRLEKEPEVRALLEAVASERGPLAPPKKETSLERRIASYEQRGIRDQELLDGRMTGEEWREERTKGVVASVAAGKARAEAMRLAPANPRTPEGKALQGYYDIYGKYETQAKGTGRVDTFSLDQEQQEYLRSLSEEHRAYVKRQLHPNATPVERRYFGLLDKMDALHWDTLYKDVPAVLAGAKLPSSLIPVYERAKAKERGGEIPTALEKRVAGEFDSAMRRYRTLLRAQDPDLDRDYVLFFSGGVEPIAAVTPKVQAELSRSVVRRGGQEVSVLNSGLGRTLSQDDEAALASSRYRTLEAIANATPRELARITRHEEATVRQYRWVEQAQAILKERE